MAIKCPSCGSSDIVMDWEYGNSEDYLQWIDCTCGAVEGAAYARSDYYLTSGCRSFHVDAAGEIEKGRKEEFDRMYGFMEDCETYCKHCASEEAKSDPDTLKTEWKKHIGQCVSAKIRCSRCNVPIQEFPTREAAVEYLLAWGKEDNIVAEPNPFSLASGELSHDAFISWLVSWVNCGRDPGMQAAGRDIVALLHNLSPGRRSRVQGFEVSSIVEGPLRRRYRQTDTISFRAVIADMTIAFTLANDVNAFNRSTLLGLCREEACGGDNHVVEPVCVFLTPSCWTPADRENGEHGYGICDFRSMKGFLKAHEVDNRIFNQYKQCFYAKHRLQALAEFLPRLEEPGFILGEWVKQREVEPGVMSTEWYALSPVAGEFIETAYDFGWIRGSWIKWLETPDGQRLKDPEAVATATAEQLRMLLTTIVRQDRFYEGTLDAFYKGGLIMAIVRRAAVLAAECGDEGAQLSNSTSGET